MIVIPPLPTPTEELYFELDMNWPLSRGGHIESRENRMLCFCTASLALKSRLAEACRAKTKLFIRSRLNMAAEW